MFRRLSIVCLLFAWLCSSGALLETTQVFAWVRMFTGYVRTMPIEEAATWTMDPGKPCAICVAVQQAREAREHQKPATVATHGGKILLACHKAEPFVFVPVRPEWPDGLAADAVSWRKPVPVPPPRAAICVLIG